MRTSIGWKLGFGFGVLILIIAINSLVILVNVDTMHRALEKPASSTDPITLTAQKMSLNVIDVQTGVLKYLATGDAKYQDEAGDVIAGFDQLKIQFDQLATTEIAKKLGDAINIFYQEHKALAGALESTRDHQKAVSIAMSGKLKKIYELVHKRIQTEKGRKDQALFHELETRLGNRLRAFEEGKEGFVLQDAAFFQGLLAQLSNLSLTPGEKRFIEGLEKLFHQITLLLRQADNIDADLQTKTKKFLDLGSKINHILDNEILILARQNLQAQVDTAFQAGRRTRKVILLMLFLGFVIGGSTTIIISSRIVRSVRQLVASTRKIGNGMLEQKVDIKTKDEFGELGAAFNRMTGELREATLRTKRLEAEKLSLAKEISAGAAHEVKNLLTVVQQGTDYLAREAKTNGSAASLVLQEINGATKRACYVMKGLSQVADLSGSELKMEPVALNSLVEQALLSVEDLRSQSHIEVLKDFQTDLLTVKVDCNHIREVFLHLFLNAIEAMPSGGQLKIRIYARELTEVGPKIGRRSEDVFRLGDTAAVVDIEDTGSGIPEAVLPRIFDPFFTTKREKGGTGLGLAVVRSTVEMHSGTIEISNRAEGGAKATLMLKTV